MRAMIVSLCVLAICGSAMAVSVAGSGSGPTAGTPTGLQVYGGRARSNNTGWELAAGVAPGQVGQFNSANFNWGQQSYEFAFVVNAGTAALTVGNTTTSYSGLAAANNLFLQTKTRDRASASLTVSNLQLTPNGGSAFGFGPIAASLPASAVSGDANYSWIWLAGVPDNYTLTGTLSGSLFQNYSERVAFDIVGTYTASQPPVPEPLTVSSLCLAVAGLGRYVRRRVKA